MGFDGSGNYARVTSWAADKAAAIKITASRHDLQDDDFAVAFNAVMLRNGIAPMTGALKMGGNNITGIGDGVVGAPSISFTDDVTSGFYSAATGQINIAIAGAEVGRITNLGLTVGAFGVNTFTPRTAADIADLLSIQGVFEDTAYSTTALTGALNIDYSAQALIIFDANAVGNFTFNIRGDGTHTLDSLMEVGQTLTTTVEVPQGVAAFYCTAITVDGAAPAQIKWFGGAPAAGNVSGIDVYAISVYKKAAATFYVRASQQQAK